MFYFIIILLIAMILKNFIKDIGQIKELNNSKR